MRRIVILGAGNELLGDEGVGVHAARALQTELPPTEDTVEVIDAGTCPDICYMVEGADKLVIVDAVRGGCEPGTIYRFTPDEIEADRGVVASVHELGLLENLSLMALVDGKPRETVIIGVEPAELKPGLELSRRLQNRMPRILETVLREIRQPDGAD